MSVLVEDRPRRPSSSRARTVLKSQDGSLASAHVYLKPSLDAPELIAHELEHILEQLDGVDLQAQAGNGVVWKAAMAPSRRGARSRRAGASHAKSRWVLTSVTFVTGRSNTRPID